MVTGQSDAKSSGRRDDVKAIVRLLLPTVARWRANDTLGFQKLLPEIEGKLVRAGLRRLQTPEAFVAQSLLGVICVVGALLIIGLVLMLAAGTSLLTVLFLCLMGAAVAWMAPSMQLGSKISNRVSLIEKQLPFAIEFIVLSMEARASYPGAVETYCDQFPTDPLAEELALVLQEVTYGTSTQAALAGFASRVQSVDVSAFVVAVNAGLDTGQPIKKVMQIQSDAARERRFLAAERVAKTAATRALAPLMMVVGAVLLVLLGPVLISMSSAF